MLQFIRKYNDMILPEPLSVYSESFHIFTMLSSPGTATRRRLRYLLWC